MIKLGRTKILLTYRRATTRSVMKVVCFLRKEKRARFGVYFFISIHNLTQSKLSKFLRHFPTLLVPSLTLQISYFVHTSLESPTLEFFAYHLPYSRYRCLVTWKREGKLYKVSDGTRVVSKCLTNFLVPCYWSGCVLEWRNIPQTLRKKYTTFSTERIVALRCQQKFSWRATVSQLTSGLFFNLCNIQS